MERKKLRIKTKTDETRCDTNVRPMTALQKQRLRNKTAQWHRKLEAGDRNLSTSREASGLEWSCWASRKNFFSSFQHAARRQAPAWARGCQAPLKWLYQSQSSLKSITHTHQKAAPAPPLWPEPSGPLLAVCIYLFGAARLPEMDSALAAARYESVPSAGVWIWTQGRVEVVAVVSLHLFHRILLHPSAPGATRPRPLYHLFPLVFQCWGLICSGPRVWALSATAW